jgi:hypothetical protein
MRKVENMKIIRAILPHNNVMVDDLLFLCVGAHLSNYDMHYLWDSNWEGLPLVLDLPLQSNLLIDGLGLVIISSPHRWLHCQLDEVNWFFQDKLVNTVGPNNIIWPKLFSCPLLWEISCVLASLVALLGSSCHCLMMVNCFQVSVMFLGTPCYLFSLPMTTPCDILVVRCFFPS